MKLIHRFGYYLGGFAVGLIFLAFFLSGKRTSCDYGPEARVLKNIRIKPMTYSESVSDKLASFKLDSTAINNILSYGDVNFKLSNTKLDSCKTYHIEGIHNEKEVVLNIANCDSITKLLEVNIK